MCLSCGSGLGAAGWACTRCGHAPPVREGFVAFAPELSGVDEGFDPVHFELLDRYEREHFWFVARRELIADLLGRHFPGARSLLEIGCGNGQVLAAIAAAHPSLALTGSEIHAAGLKLAAAALGRNAALYQMDARRIPFREEFDVIGAFDVLEHIDEDETALREMHAAARPGGGIMVSVPQHPWLWSDVDETAHHRRRYARGELDRKVEAAGFRILRSTSFVTLPLPLMIGSRLGRSRRQQPGAEFAIGALTNRVLTRILRLEAKLVSQGVSLPIGGTRFVIAAKDRS